MNLAGFNPFRPGRRLVEPVAPDPDQADLPRSADVAVVGGGIAGLIAAVELARRGQKVVLLEKGRVGAEQTSRALGWVASLGDTGLRLPLSLRSKELWRSYQNDHAIDTSFRACGLTIVCRSTREMEMFAAWSETARAVGEVDAEPLGLPDLAARLPQVTTPGAVGAWWQPSDGVVFPAQVAPALARIARNLGVHIVETCAVREIDRSAGRASGVATEKGLLRSSAVLLAGGAWSRRLLRDLGINLVQLPVYSSLYRTEPVTSDLPAIGATGSFAWARREDGSLVIGNNSAIASVTLDSLRLLRPFLPSLLSDHGSLSLDLDADFLQGLRDERVRSPHRPFAYERNRMLGAVPDAANGLKVLASLRREIPSLAQVALRSSWAGIIDVTPDKAPIIEQTGCAGLYVCTGFSAHGLAMAPAAAEMAADLIVGNDPRLAPGPYSNSRFKA